MSPTVVQPPVASNHAPRPEAPQPEGVTPPDRFLTASNLLSLTRALLAIPFLLLMFSSLPAARWWAAGLMVLGAITDKLDGMLARKRRQETEWGRIIDPLADKIAVAVVAFTLLYVGDIPVWFVVLLVARDVVIFSGGMYLKTTRGTVLGSNTTGKWAFGIAGLTLFVLLVSGMSIVAEALMLICVVLLATSFVLYVRRFLQVVGGNA